MIFFRESDRVAICRDVIRNLSYATYRPMLAEPPAPEIFTRDRHGRLRPLERRFSAGS